MIEIGPVVRLQVQTGSLKRGERPHRVYDPAPLRPVECLRLSRAGALGVTAGGEEIPDVHHSAHPRSQSEPGREASFGFTGHYAAMQGRYGPRLIPGCAGENILIETARVWRLEDFGPGLALRSAATGELGRLEDVSVAAPCVEFSRFTLDSPAASPQELKPVLQFLDEGTRGYVFTPAADFTLRVGDFLVRLD